MKTICLVAPGHVSSTPRLVKAADALSGAGYSVWVVAGRSFPPADAFDAEIFAAAPWQHTVVDHLGAGAAPGKILRRLARLVARVRPAFSMNLAARAYHEGSGRLAGAAAGIRANLYIGHCLPGLPAAAAAARSRSAAYGFDAEDYYGSETEESAVDSARSAAVRALQSRLLPGCALFTAASPLIASRYLQSYGAQPAVLLNVFPESEAPDRPADPGPVSLRRPARLYWFSQTIGPGRGLEAAVAAAARMHTPVELHLRGFIAPEYAGHLRTLAAKAGLGNALFLLPPAPSGEMARLAAGFDLGLSIEEARPLNRDLCLTNKIFVYLLAGIPQLMSQTSAQKALAPELGEAALCCPMEKPAEVAHRLDDFFSQPQRVSASRSAASSLARSRYCWDREKEILLGQVRAALESRP